MEETNRKRTDRGETKNMRKGKGGKETLPEITIEDLPEPIQQAASRASWPCLTPVQAKAIPYAMARRDMMVQSRTGSGKTGAFMLPILDRINVNSKTCQALVLAPTRELARQVAATATTLAGNSGVNVVSVYGGVGYGPQIDGFRKGAHIVVGTPGRILDHLMKRSLVLDGLDTLVFDEADRMLSMGFYPDMKQLQKHIPKRDIHCMMFSATFPPSVLRLAREFLREPETVSLSQDHVHVVETEHIFYITPSMKKDRALVKIIEAENPESAIIFCNTKAQTHYVAVVLRRFGYDADEISSDLSQSARERVLARARGGSLRFMVATDVAARGIDIPNLSHVILYEPPEDQESYIHRAGRTGRAGAKGQAISLVAEVEKFELLRIARSYKIELQERVLPTDEQIADIVSQRATALLEARFRTLDNMQRENAERFVSLARDLANDAEEASLVAMLLNDYYQRAFHAPPPLKPAPASVKPPSISPRRRRDGRDGKRRRRR